MILAGDIGGTNARLAYFQSQNGNLRLISERVFPSREYTELGEIVSEFLKKTDARPDVACFGIAGPVHHGRVETSNLPWIIEQSRLAKQIQLPATLLINDLEANAWGIGELNPQDLTALNSLSQAVGNQAVIAPGTGLGEAGLFWNGSQHEVFACEGGHADFAPQGDLQIDHLASSDSRMLALLRLEQRNSSWGPKALRTLGLTPREAEVLYWITEGKTNPEISTILDTTLHTIKKHNNRLFAKLGVETRMAAARLALSVLTAPAE